MRGVRAAAVVFAALVTAGSAHAAPSLADYGRLPTLSEVEISPDGSKLAVLGGDADHREIQICDAATRKATFQQDMGPVKVRYLKWAGPNHLLIITSVTAEARGVLAQEAEHYMAADLDLKRNSILPLMDQADKSLNTIIGIAAVLDKGEKPVLIVTGVYLPPHEDFTVFALYRIELGSGRTEMIQIGEPDTDQFLVGPDGKAAARADYNQRSGRWSLRVKTPSGWKEAYSEIAPIDPPAIEGLGADGQTVLVDKPNDDDWKMHEASLRDASWSLAPEKLRDVALVRDPASRKALGGTTRDMEHTVYTFLAPHDQAVWDAVARAFPREEVTLESWSDDRRRVVIKVEGLREGAGYALIDTSKGTADWLGDEYEAIGPETLAERRVVSYKAADGFEVPAYLTLPRDRPAKKLPLVVLVHGGPQARDEPGFDWWSQALASRGYAVLQPQYRGSDGFGEAHLQAGYGEWGRKMQSDLSDGVRALAKSGEIDPGRVCIMGASYGGYAALAGAVLDPGAYRCAVSISGPADLRRFLAWKDARSYGEDKESQRYWDRFLGVSSRKDPALDALSPALHADKAAMPILLIHGQDDTVVPYEQSTQMAAALKAAGKPVEFVTLKSEDHWLSRSETRLQMLSAAAAFLEAHNPPDEAKASADAPGKAPAGGQSGRR